MPKVAPLAHAVEFARVAGVQRLVDRFQPYVGRRWFPLVAGVLAFGATASLSVPVVPVLVSLVAMRRERWRALAFWAVLGSTLAGTLITCLAAHFGMALVDARLPQLAQSKHWHYMVEWTARYGVFALAAVAASPFAQTPALLLAAMLGMRWPGVALALAIGKSAKYGVMAVLAAKASDTVASLTGHGGASAQTEASPSDGSEAMRPTGSQSSSAVMPRGPSTQQVESHQSPCRGASLASPRQPAHSATVSHVAGQQAGPDADQGAGANL